MKNKNLLVVAAATIFMSFLSLSLFAQAGPPPSPGAGGPIDGGVLTLVVGAAVMGYKKHKAKKEAEKKGE